MKKIKKKTIINLMLIITLIIILSFSIYKIFDILLSKYENNKLYNEIIDKSKIEEKVVKKETNETIFINVDFKELLKMNSDTIGWISFNEISYPFVQASDNGYYLKRSYNKKNNMNGTLFLDYRNNDLNDNNTIIYGHNTADRSMFGSLKKLLKKDYFDNDFENIIRISTPLVNYNYQVFSVYNIEKEDYYITTSFTNKEFKLFINTITKRSYHKFDIVVDSNDKILTLSTCSGGSGTTKRTVVHAKLIEKEIR